MAHDKFVLTVDSRQNFWTPRIFDLHLFP